MGFRDGWMLAVLIIFGLVLFDAVEFTGPWGIVATDKIMLVTP